MKRLAGICSETALLVTEGAGYAVAVELTSAGDEPVPVSGVHLSRKGINAFPEFADGFGLDSSKVIEGLAPERYQFRTEMLLAHQGNLMYGNGKSEFRLSPGKSVKFVMPIPFQGIPYYLNAPPDDLFVAVTSLSDEDLTVDVEGLHGVLEKCFQERAQLGKPFNVQMSIIVPQSAPPSDEAMKKAGTTNQKAIRPMPNN